MRMSNHRLGHGAGQYYSSIGSRANWSMIRKKPVLGLDPRMEAGFPKRSCSTKMPERKSLQSEAISI
jgi:hypothetical protein